MLTADTTGDDDDSYKRRDVKNNPSHKIITNNGVSIIPQQSFLVPPVVTVPG